MTMSKDHDATTSRIRDAGPSTCNRPTAVLLVAITCASSLCQTLSAEEKITAIKGGDLYTMTSGVIKGGTILIKDGKIWQIGQGLEVPKDANVIDAAGKVVMPGFVAATTMSMPAAGFRPDKIADSLDPFHYSVSLALASGVTSIFVRGRSPSSREPLGGTNAVIKPTYGDLDNMLVREPIAENLNIGGTRWMQKTDFVLKMRQTRDYLRQVADHEKAKEGNERAKAPRKPSGIDAYLRLLRHERPARLSVVTASEILAALELVDEFRFRLIIEDAVEAWTIAEEIAGRDVALIITPRAKRRPNERISHPSGSNVENAAILKKAGVKFAIVPATPYFALWGVAGRDLMTLPMEAAFAVAGGLDEQTALEAITITAAEILGIEDRVGSLQVGKDADIVVLDGHPLHYNSFVELTFVNGKLLYDKSKSTFFSHIRRYDDKMPGGPPGAGELPISPEPGQ